MQPRADVDHPVPVELEPGDALGSYLRAVSAHPLLVVAVLLATSLAAAAFLSQRSPQYKATAELLVEPVAEGDDTFLGLPVIKESGDPTRTIQTAAALLQSTDAAQAAAQRLGAGWTERRILSHVAVQPEGQSNILAVTAKAGSGTEAVAIANAFAIAELQRRDAALRGEAAVVIDRLKVARAHLRSGDPSAAGLDSRIGQLEDIRVSGDPTTRLSSLATTWISAEGLPSWLILALAFAAGFVLGSAAALLAERLGPRTIRAEEELGEIDPAPVLARIPTVRSRWRAQRRRRALDLPPTALTSFRSLELQLRAQEGEHRAVLFTSPSASDGKTTSVVEFALELAAAEREVIVFDLDLRKPDLARAFGVVEEASLHSALQPGAGLADALSAVPGVPFVHVVPGIADADGATLEHVGRRLPDLIAEARSRASYALVDTSPLGEVADALRFTDAVDDVILVARLNNTRVADVETVRDVLRRARRPATGYILRGRRAGSPGTRRPHFRLEQPLRPKEGAPAPPPPPTNVAATGGARSVSDLIAAGLLAPEAELVGSAQGRQHVACVRGGQIELNGASYPSLSAAAASLTGKRTNGWTFWHARVDDANVPLAQLRNELLRRG